MFNRVDVDLKIQAAQGAGLALVEMNIMNNLPYDPVHVGLFYARYILNALDFPKDAIEGAMKMLKETAAGGHSKQNRYRALADAR